MSDNDIRAQVVYESMFGNTEKVARAIREGLEQAVDTELARVDRCPATVPAGVRLLVVGGPTHAFSMSRASTRAEASSQGDVVMPPETGIREWIDGLDPPDGRVVVATFDTRVTKARRLPGSAAKAAARALRRRGVRAGRRVRELLRRRLDRPGVRVRAGPGPRVGRTPGPGAAAVRRPDRAASREAARPRMADGPRRILKSGLSRRGREAAS